MRDIIKAAAIKAGMVIGIKRRKDFDDIVLVLAKTGFTKVSYTFLDYADGYGGALCSDIGGKEKVKVIKGLKRKAVLKSIKDDVFKNLHDIQNLIDTIRLIEDME